MFRGLDTSDGGEPNHVPILVADRPTFDVTLYVRRGGNDERRAELRKRLQRLTDAGVVESVETRQWSESPPPARFDCARPEAFGLAIRREGTLVGWYPNRGSDRGSLEDGLGALCIGEAVGNVPSTPEDPNHERKPTHRPVPVDSYRQHSPPKA
jgi:hypothetical protein